MPYPPNHDERMEVLNATTASHSGWRKDETTMADLEIEATRLMEEYQEVVARKRPLVKSLVQGLMTLCSDLNIRRHSMDKARATQLLSTLDQVRDEMRRLWANPHTPEIREQIALLEPAYKLVNDRLNSQWPECRSESVAERCAELGQALQARRLQMAQRCPFATFSKAV